MTDAGLIDAILPTVSEALGQQVPELVGELERRRAGVQRGQGLWDIANRLGEYCNGQAVTNRQKALCQEAIRLIREHEGEKAATSRAPGMVVFGTSGWRAVIGEEFTVFNVHKVIRGIIEMMRTPRFLSDGGYKSFEEVRTHGVVVLRDNRFMGEAFIEAATRELTTAGIRVMRAGECPTGVGSALVVALEAAGSVNFTPSHNPMEYAGIKFNPSDGGPADSTLTSIIEEKANALMHEAGFIPAAGAKGDLVADIDAKSIFLDFLKRNAGLLKLQGIRDWLRAQKHELHLLVDYMHGAARGYVELILGQELVDELKDAGAIAFRNTEDDYSFHGIKPEPNARNQRVLIEELRRRGRRYSLAAALDPDGDRVRFGDWRMDMEMNRFGAIAYAHLLGMGIKGGIGTTVATSDFGREIARREGLGVVEVPVGFKNFREPFKRREVIVAYEESDGISVAGHTLEKCGLVGIVLALGTMAATGKNLSEQYCALQRRYGYFYPGKGVAEAPGMGVDAWLSYRQEVMEALCQSIAKVGGTVQVGSDRRAITAVGQIDGVKLVLEDKSWILLRPSGTEPLFRYYYEVASESELKDPEERLRQYDAAAREILSDAMKLRAPAR